MYIMCACLFSALSRRVGALQISIIIIIITPMLEKCCITIKYITFIRPFLHQTNAMFNQRLEHSCQSLLGVNISPEFVNLYFPYAGKGLLFLFCWWQRHFEFQPACVAVEWRSNVVLNMHVRLQISLLVRFLSLLHKSSLCIWWWHVSAARSTVFQSFCSV